MSRTSPCAAETEREAAARRGRDEVTRDETGRDESRRGGASTRGVEDEAVPVEGMMFLCCVEWCDEER